MRKICLILITVFGAVKSSGQIAELTSNPHKDITNRILSEIQTKGSMSGGITLGNYGKPYRYYRLCAYLEIDTLSEYCTIGEIDALLYHPNGSLRAVGFILYAKRYNNKDSVLKVFHLLLEQEYTMFNLSGCSDAVTISNLARYCYTLMSGRISYFKPSFTLNKADTIRIERDIDFYERKVSMKNRSTTS